MSVLVVFKVPQLVDSPIVDGGCCGVAREWVIEEAIGQLPGTQGIRADDETGQVTVCFDSEKVNPEQITDALAGLGFLLASFLQHSQVER